MKTALTKREKILLFAVGLIAILYVSIQFVILPLSNRYSEGIADRDRLNIEKSSHDMEAATLPSLRDRNVEAHFKFSELIEDYPIIEPNEIIDKMLTTLVNNNNLRPTSLRFAPRDEPPPPPAGQAPAPEFIKVTAQMNVVGSYISLVRLMDEVSNITFMHLTTIGFTQNRQLGLEDQSSINLTFELTFVSDVGEDED